MYRRTAVVQIAPIVGLPLVKIGFLFIRQIAKPAIQTVVRQVNKNPHARRVMVYIGWTHYRSAVALQRLVWGMEQRELTAVPHTAAAATPAAATHESPPQATAGAAHTVRVAAPGDPHGALHRATHRLRGVFIPPPRPNDAELVQKAASLLCETLVFVVLLALTASELSSMSADKKARREILEQRFRRLEVHLVSCPETQRSSDPAESVESSGAPASPESATGGLAALATDAVSAAADVFEHAADGVPEDDLEEEPSTLPALRRRLPPERRVDRGRLGLVDLAMRVRSVHDIVAAFAELPRLVQLFLVCCLTAPSFAAMLAVAVARRLIHA